MDKGTNPRRKALQRLFTTFPAGRPGLGLLLLRVAIGATLIAQGLAYWPEPQDMRIGAWVASLLALSSGLSLLLGFLTPLSGSGAALACLGGTFLLFPAENWNFFHGNPLSLDVAGVAVATALLGPGAFSLDALLFGRRKIIIPRRPMPPTW
jgi:uncharacterized membrane protein YphA (DoxX/SURF4 family)